MAKLKRLLLWGGILLIGGILMLGAAANEMMSSILGDNQQTNITEDMLNGLPDWITPEMVQGAIDMMHENGYPASVVLGQMILEGGAGGSELSNPPYYNCLGQKSPSYGENGTVTMQTEEAVSYTHLTLPTKITELWRKRNGHYADRRSVGNSNGGIFHICKL